MLVLAVVAFGWVAVVLSFAAVGNHVARSSLPGGFVERLDSRQAAAGRPYVVLLVGTDRRKGARASGRADSIMLLRVDARHDRVSALSVPRNLTVRTPESSDAQLAHLMQAGGVPRLARVIEGQLGIDVDHVMQVDVGRLRQIVDAVGGVDLHNPTEVRNRTYAGRAWHFPEGRIHLDGASALAFSRIRTNPVNDHESDSSRGLRQQLVVAALARRLADPRVLARPRAAYRVLASLRTDMRLHELVAAAWEVRHARLSVRCRLGGSFRGERPASQDPREPRPGQEMRIARPAFILRREGLLDDPWLLDADPGNGRVVAQFLAGTSGQLDRSNPAYPVGCVRTNGHA